MSVESVLEEARSSIIKLRPDGSVTGLRRAAKLYSRLGTDAVAKAADDTDAQIDIVVCNTEGKATSAFRHHGNHLEHSVKEISSVALTMADALRDFADEINGARNEMNSLIHEIDGRLAVLRAAGSLGQFGGSTEMINRARHLVRRARDVETKVIGIAHGLATRMTKAVDGVHVPDFTKHGHGDPRFTGGYEEGVRDGEKIEINFDPVKRAASRLCDAGEELQERLTTFSDHLSDNHNMIGQDRMGRAFAHGYSPASRGIRRAVDDAAETMYYIVRALNWMHRSHEDNERDAKERLDRAGKS